MSGLRGEILDRSDGLAFDLRKRLLNRFKLAGRDVDAGAEADVEVGGVTSAADGEPGWPLSSESGAGWAIIDCFERQQEWFIVVRCELVSARRTRGAGGTLSAREREVAVRAAAGTPLKIIAAALQVGVPTVATHLRRARIKLRAGSRAELARAMARQDTALGEVAAVVELCVGGTLFRLLQAPLAPPRRWLRVLSPTEMTVSMAVIHGMRNAEIASARGTSVRTVAGQVSTIMLKVAVTSRAELIASAVGCHKNADGRLQSRS
jgi:DNA-binding CsgD family transcriptional regulator